MEIVKTPEAFGLFDSLSQDEISNAMSIAEKNLKEIDFENEEINLKIDQITVPGLNFAAVSWIGPTFKVKTTNYGFRVMGVFNTMTEAHAYAIKINKLYPMYDTGIMQLNHFCLGYPDSSDYDESIDKDVMIKKIDGVINKFIIKHKKVKEFKKQVFEIRKNKLKDGPTKTKEFETETDFTVPIGGDVSAEAIKMHEENIQKIFKKDTKNTSLKESESFDESLDLTPCNTKIYDQEYVILSYVGNEGKNKRIPINIKGAFSTKEDAEAHVENLMSIDDTYDIVVSPMYCWIPCDPLLDSVKQIFPNEKLNDMFEAHQNESINTKSFHNAVKSTNQDVLTKVNINSEKGTKGYSEHISEESDPELVTAGKMLKSLFSYNDNVV